LSHAACCRSGQFIFREAAAEHEGRPHRGEEWRAQRWQTLPDTVRRGRLDQADCHGVGENLWVVVNELMGRSQQGGPLS
jgi:hypothetical protein